MKEFLPVIVVIIAAVALSAIVRSLSLGKDKEGEGGLRRPWFFYLGFAFFFVAATVAAILLKKDLYMIVIFAVLAAVNIGYAIFAKVGKK